MGVISDYLELISTYPDYPVLRFDRQTGRINDYSKEKQRLTLPQHTGELINPRIEQCCRTRHGNYIIRYLVESGLNDSETWQESDAILFIALSDACGEDELIKTSYADKCKMFAELDWQPAIVVDLDGGNT